MRKDVWLLPLFLQVVDSQAWFRTVEVMHENHVPCRVSIKIQKLDNVGILSMDNTFSSR